MSVFSKSYLKTLIVLGGVLLLSTTIFAAEISYQSSIPYDISNPILETQFHAAVGTGINVRDVEFSRDGLKMFTLEATNTKIDEYNLTVPFDVSTAALDAGASLSTAPETQPLGFTFNSDGTLLYIVGSGSDILREYDLLPAYDVSTASLSQSIPVGTEDTFPYDVAFSNDGMKMYILGDFGNDVTYYSLSSPFDILAHTAVGTVSVGGQETTPRGFDISRDGTTMFVTGTDSDQIHKYTLSPAFDMSSATYSSSFDSSEISIASFGLATNQSGTRLYLYDNFTDDIFQYRLDSVQENVTNDGSVTGSIVAKLTGDTFAPGFTIADVTLGNVPTGLNPQVSVTGGDTATFSFTGNAGTHTASQDVYETVFTFTDSAFATLSASVIDFATGPAGSGVGFTFYDIPSQVMNLSGSTVSTQMTLAWDEVIGIPDVTDYQIEYKLNSSGVWTVFADGVSTDLTATVIGLTDDTLYDFRVSAINALGAGQTSGVLTKEVIKQTYYHIFSTGQSLSVGSQGSPAVSLTQPYNNLMLTHAADAVPAVTGFPGSQRNALGVAAPLIPLVETSNTNWESPSSAMANTLSAFDNAANPDRNFVVGLHGDGGKSYDQIKKGTTTGHWSYSQGQAQASVTKTEVETTLNANYVPLAVTLVHGEQDWLDGTAAGNPAPYEGYLDELQRDYEADLNTLMGTTGTSIPLFYSQQNTRGMHEMAVAQYRAQKTYDDVHLIGPTYQYTFADGTHLNDSSYKRLGEQFAKVMDTVLFEGQPWEPLAPQSVILSGQNVVITYNVPVGSLVLDTTNVVQRADGNYGFEFSETGGTGTAITGVTLAGTDTVTIALDSVPTGTDQKISYAAQNIAGNGHGDPTDPAGSGGNLRDSDTTVSPSTQSTNSPLYNWGVSFEESIVSDSVPPVVSFVTTQKVNFAPIENIDILVTDTTGILPAGVTVDGTGTTATISDFACTAVSATEVSCEIDVDTSGDIAIRVEDTLGNFHIVTNPDYIIEANQPSVTITAPTKTSMSAITSTTIQVTDDNEILAAAVTIGGATTATTSTFNCTQTSTTVVDCTISIDTSGNLEVDAIDVAGNTTSSLELGYVLETNAPVGIITAPTLSGTTSITDTTIQVTDDNEILAAAVTIGGATTATTSTFNCTQTSATIVDCAISIDASGDLVITATDVAGNFDTYTQTGYDVTVTTPSSGGGGGSRGSSSALIIAATMPDIEEIIEECEVVMIGRYEIGSRGESVRSIQQFLATKGYNPGSIDGIFGGKTKTAVAAFQKDNRLQADGIAGPNTLRVISTCDQVDTVTQVTPAELDVAIDADNCSAQTARLGDRGPTVRSIQQALLNKGYSPGLIDGIFGGKTKIAATSFQRDNRLSVDGVVGPVTQVFLCE